MQAAAPIVAGRRARGVDMGVAAPSVANYRRIKWHKDFSSA
jgi:hypothetical protein